LADYWNLKISFAIFYGYIYPSSPCPMIAYNNIQGFWKKISLLIELLGKILTDKSIKSDTFFPETLYMTNVVSLNIITRKA